MARNLIRSGTTDSVVQAIALNSGQVGDILTMTSLGMVQSLAGGPIGAASLNKTSTTVEGVSYNFGWQPSTTLDYGSFASDYQSFTNNCDIDYTNNIIYRATYQSGQSTNTVVHAFNFSTSVRLGERVINSMGNGGFYKVIRTTTGRIVVATRNSSSNNIQFCTIAADFSSNTAVQASVGITAAAVGNSAYFDMRPLPGGNFAIIFVRNADNDLVYQVYNDNGVLQSGPTVIRAAISAAFSVLTCTNGDIIVVTTNNNSCYRYNPTMTTLLNSNVGGLAGNNIGMANCSYNMNNIIERPNGEIWIVLRNTSTTAFNLTRLTNTLSIINTYADFTSWSSTGFIFGIYQSSDFVVVVSGTGTSGGYIFNLFNSNGALISKSSSQNVSFVGGLSTCIGFMDNANFYVVGCFSNANTAQEQLITLTYNFVSNVPTQTTIVGSLGSHQGSVFTLFNNSRCLALVLGSGSGIGRQIQFIPETVFGVALSNFTAGSFVSVGVRGTFNIRNLFLSSGAVDARAITPPGNRANWNRNTITLGGLL